MTSRKLTLLFIVFPYSYIQLNMFCSALFIEQAIIATTWNVRNTLNFSLKCLKNELSDPQFLLSNCHGVKYNKMQL